MEQISLGLRNALLGSNNVSGLLTGCAIYIFNGPIPASADEALDMTSTHTQLAVIEPSGGISFDTPTNGLLPKQASQTWEGTIAFDGAQSGASSLAATFFRIAASGDNARGAGSSTSYRIQGTAGGPNDGGEMDVGAATLVANGTNTVTLTVGNIRMPSA